jgi:hypothetical protein
VLSFTFALNVALEHTIGRVQEYQKSLKLNGAHQLRVYGCAPNNISLMDENINIVKTNTETLLVASKATFVKEFTTQMFMSRHCKSGTKS